MIIMIETVIAARKHSAAVVLRQRSDSFGNAFHFGRRSKAATRSDPAIKVNTPSHPHCF